MNIDYLATEKLKLNAGFTYNKAEDSWDWSFSERTLMTREDTLATLADSASGPGAYAPVDYDTWDQNNNIDEYSDLSYEQYQISLGGTYNFTDTFYANVSGTYDIFEMDEEYVYGDEDGTAYYGYAGIGFNF